MSHGYSFCTGGFSVKKKGYMDTGWATNVFVFICVNGFEYFESTIFMLLQGVDFSPGLKRITASKLSLKMRDRSHRENKANRIFNINISEEKISQSVGVSVHAVKNVVSICSENPSMGV